MDFSPMHRFTTSAFFLALTALAIPAHAGFEWIPPTAAEARPVMAQPNTMSGGSSAMVPMPSKPGATVTTTQTTQTQTLTPMPGEQPAPAMAAPRGMIVEQRVENTSPNIVWNDSQAGGRPQVTPVAMNTSSSANAPRDLTPEPVIGSSVAGGSSEKVEGFGRDVPLTVATRQMVPQGYVVQYGQGVDPNTTVTWTGGRSWKESLGDALAEKNLKATVIADSVMIEPVAPSQQLRAEPLGALVTHTQTTAPLPPVTEVTVTNTTTTSSGMQSPMLQNVAYTPATSLPGPQVWVAPRASTLRQVLTDWSREAGVQLQWSAQYDYPLMSDVQLSGTFEEAVETLLSGLVDAQPRPVARLHPNAPSGPPILVVETRHILE